ncbi:MAG: hypothetical protein WAW11_02710 [Patescibacteria group bacterium]
MKQLLCFLLLVVLSLLAYGQKPETEIVIEKDSSYQIYQINKVPLGKLNYVDKDIPLYAVNKAYSLGSAVYDSTVVTCHYSYKNLWLKRTSDLNYKTAVYNEATQEVKIINTIGTWPKLPAYEIYVLLLAVVILFFSLLFGTKEDYDGWDIQYNQVIGASFCFPVAFCMAVNIIVYFSLGRNPFTLFVFSAACFVFLAAIIKTIKANWTKNLYLILQKIVLLSTLVSLGVITHSIIFPTIIAALFIGILSIFIPIRFSSVKVRSAPSVPSNKFID